MWVLMLGMAMADGRQPHECKAVWVGPQKECGLPGVWAVTGAGKTESSAQKKALDALKETIDQGALAAALRADGTLAEVVAGPQQETCGQDAADQATVTCVPSVGLEESQLCFVDLTQTVCGYTNRFTVEGVGYRAHNQGRRQMCGQLETHLRQAGAEELELAECQALCTQAARVRCPGIATR